MAEPVEGLKFLGAFSVALACILAAFMLRTWRGDRTMSLSRHAASHKLVYLLFASILTFDGALFYVFLWKWYMPALGLSAWFGFVLIAAAIFQLLAAWIPDKIGWQTKAHTFNALAVAACMMVQTLLIILVPHLPGVLKALAAAYLLMSLYFGFLYLFVARAKQHFLAYQSVFFLGFYAIILLTTYIR